MRTHTFIKSTLDSFGRNLYGRRVYFTRSRAIRRLALAVAFLFVWSWILAPAAKAAESTRVNLEPAKAWLNTAWSGVTAVFAPMSVYGGAGHLALPSDPATLLNDVGHLTRYPSQEQLKSWRNSIRSHHPCVARLAQLHIWLGEYALAQDQQPEEAAHHFRLAESLIRKTDPAYGLAVYDTALAVYYEGAYSAASDDFHSLLASRLVGYPRQTCALWYREASECAQYHESHTNIGIPEPTRLDPLCAAAAIAARLRTMSLPYDQRTVLKAVHVTGEGSTLQDVVNAGPKLGLSIRAVKADDQGLIHLPKPLVAWVERDHFVAVVKADHKGVSYLCSDCGPWPGGQVDLTWRQWHTMATGVYAVITMPGSTWDQAIQAALAIPYGRESQPVRVASTNLSGLGIGKVAPQIHVLAALLESHVIGGPPPDQGQFIGCGNKISSMHPSLQNCPCDHSPNGDPVELATGEEQYTPPADLTVYNPYGPSVTWSRIYNSLRATSPEYLSDDFGAGWSHGYNVVLYDPTMTWSFGDSGGYSSGSGGQGTGGSGGGTTGGSTSTSGTTGGTGTSGSTTGGSPDFWITLSPTSDTVQSCAASAPTSTVYVNAANGFSGSVTLSASVSSPSNGITAVVNPGSVNVSSTATTQGYTTASLQVTVPSGTTPGTYTITVTGSSTGYSNQTATYTLTVDQCNNTTGENPINPAATTPRSQEPQVLKMGNVMPEDMGLPTYSPPAAGNKDLILPNGADITIVFPTTNSGDLSANCTAELNSSAGGVPLVVTWSRSSINGQFGAYSITMPDRTVWTMSHVNIQADVAPEQETGVPYMLTQITDRMGRYLTLNYAYTIYSDQQTQAPGEGGSTFTLGYGAPGYGGSGGVAWLGAGEYSVPSYFPLLTSIQNMYNTPLLTVTRVRDYMAHSGAVPQFGDQTAGNIICVSDCYTRYVYYHTGAYATQNVPTAYPQGYQELDYVSQVTTEVSAWQDFENPANWTQQTGLGQYYSGPSDTPTALFNLQYAAVGNNDPGNGNGPETLATLGWVSQPSPTGSGSATMAITYDSSGYVTSVVDANGNTRQYTPGTVPPSLQNNGTIAGAEQVSIYAPGANTPTYTHTVMVGQNMNKIADTDGAGNVIYLYTYNDPNDPYAPSSVQDGTNHTWSFVYDQWGQLHQETDPRGTVTNYTWEYPSSQVPTVVNSIADANTSFTMGELYSVQQGSRTPTTLTYYETTGLVNTLTYPKPNTSDNNGTVEESFTYNSNGDVLTVTQPNNNATSNGITTTYTYIENSGDVPYKGEVETVADNLGDTTSFNYDERGNLYQVTGDLGDTYTGSNYYYTTTYYHNLADQLTEEIDPPTGESGSGQSYTKYNYRYPGGSLYSVARYDESNNEAAYANYALDQEGNVLEASGSFPSITQTYDAAYRLSSVTDGNNHTTDYYYNAQGYLYQVAYPGVAGTPPGPYTAGTADTVTYTNYDNDGNPLTRVDGRDITTTYAYTDANGLLNAISYNDGKTTSVGITYDSYSRPYVVTDGAGTTTYNYDDDDNVTAKQVNYTSGPSPTLSYSYYNDGSLQTLSTPAGNFNYSYDGAQRLASLTSPSGYPTNYQYYTNNWLIQQAAYNGTGTTRKCFQAAYTYDYLGNVATLWNSPWTETNGTWAIGNNYEWTNMLYNGAGNLTSMSTGGTARSAGSNSYAYDGYNQLAYESVTNSLKTYTYGSGGSGGYASDSAGNLTTIRATASQTYNADNERTNSPVAFDGNGNMTTTGSSYPCAWDAENRLTAYNTSTETNTHFADGLCRATRSTEDTWQHRNRSLWYQVSFSPDSYRLADGDT